MTMTTTRRIFVTAGLVSVATACARPPAYTPQAAGLGPLKLAVADIVIDSSALDDGAVIDEAMNFHKSGLTIDEPNGRPVKAIVKLERFNIANAFLESAIASPTYVEGTVEVVDAATGQLLFASDTINADSRQTQYNADSGVITRDRVNVKADKLSRFFMKRARLALVSE